MPENAPAIKLIAGDGCGFVLIARARSGCRRDGWKLVGRLPQTEDFFGGRSASLRALLYETVEDDRKTTLILSKPCEPVNASPTAIDRDATSPPALLGPRAPGQLFFLLVRGQGWCGDNSSGCAEPCLAAGTAR